MEKQYSNNYNYNTKEIGGGEWEARWEKKRKLRE